MLASDAVIVVRSPLRDLPPGKCMEANQLRRQLKDLSERITALRGFL
jgi:hypothetical protein